MANTFKNATLAVTNSPTAAYTCPASTQSVIHSIYFGNVDGVGDVTVDVIVYDDSKSTAFNIGNDLPIPVGSSLYFDKPINLEEGDELRLSAGDNNDVEAVLSILEIA